MLLIRNGTDVINLDDWLTTNTSDTTADNKDSEAGEVACAQAARSCTTTETILEFADGQRYGNPLVASVILAITLCLPRTIDATRQARRC